MIKKKLLASASLFPWFVTLALISGPVRWELAHTYSHLVKEGRYSLPFLTRHLSLPILGIAPISLAGQFTSVLFWGSIWFGLAGLILAIWRVRTRDDLVDRFVLGGACYASCVLLLFTMAAVGLVLPFALM